jgi:hypothetical protein
VVAGSALSYPRCTNSSPKDLDSDCGSESWAFTLFIAWNLLSMVRTAAAALCLVKADRARFQYIFVNMFTGMSSAHVRARVLRAQRAAGVVVDNFSYVFQATDGSKAITRAQMRNFKRVWALYADPVDGKLHQERLVNFLGVGAARAGMTRLV